MEARSIFCVQETVSSPRLAVAGQTGSLGHFSARGRGFSMSGHFLKQVEVNRGFIETKLSDWSLWGREAAVTDNFSISSLFLLIAK